ncbi:sulfatase [Verrucomicrobiales bacterium]|nr:sulfatase [Verrucomicrobiales bacterium]
MPKTLLFALVFALAVTTTQAERPNVILFLVDDLGWSDLGCQGSQYYQTPNIDALAESGVRFTNAYAACAVCSPTRAAVLTGKYPARLLLTQWLPAGRWNPDKHIMHEGRFLRSLPLEELTLAECLRESGYATWHIGKWHLGGAPFSLPQHHGFDVNIAGDDHGAPGSFFYPFKGKWKLPSTGEAIAKQAYSGGKESDYLTDCLTDEAIQLIKSHDEKKPFFLYFPYYAVHTPIQGKPELMEKYESVPKVKRQGKPGYASMIECVDQSIGRVLASLEQSGRKDNTLIIFTSDNGGFAGATSNAPLRANKGSHYEGGIRVPLIFAGAGIGMNAPDGIDLPVISCDLYPTILAFTQSPMRKTDGRNLAPLLNGFGEVAYDPDHPLFWHYPHYNRHPQSKPVSIIRRGKWKLIESLETGDLELYDLDEDLGETNNLAREKTELANQLNTQLADWKRSVRADPMTPNPLFQPESQNQNKKK